MRQRSRMRAALAISWHREARVFMPVAYVCRRRLQPEQSACSFYKTAAYARVFSLRRVPTCSRDAAIVNEKSLLDDCKLARRSSRSSMSVAAFDLPTS